MRLAFNITWIAILGAMAAYGLRVDGQASVRRAAYVQFYPAPVSSAGPYMGECLWKPEGAYCAQERE